MAFTDESSFTLRPLKKHMRVRRKVNIRYVLKNIVPTFKSGYVPLCVWGMFSSKGHSPLVRMSGTLNQMKYRKTLKNYVVPFQNQLHAPPKNFIYQHDGRGPHLAKKVSAFLEAQNNEVLSWSSQSLDLNPIEFVWAEIKMSSKEARYVSSYYSFPIFKAKRNV